MFTQRTIWKHFSLKIIRLKNQFKISLTIIIHIIKKNQLNCCEKCNKLPIKIVTEKFHEIFKKSLHIVLMFILISLKIIANVN